MTKRWRGIALGAMAFLGPWPAWADSTERVSVSSSGAPGNGYSGQTGVALSADGRFVAFASVASNLVKDDTNGDVCGSPPCQDVFVRDRTLGTTERVSVSSSGAEGNSASGEVGLAISADGRFVAFDSRATNLVPGDTNAARDIFVRDRRRGKTERVSISSSGEQANGLGDADSYGPAISADGRFVAFASYASNLVEGDTNEAGDVFVRDRWTGKTERANVSSSGAQAKGGIGNSFPIGVSANGRFVAFVSDATDLVKGDTNRAPDVFVRDRRRGKTERVSISSKGVQSNDWASGNGWITGDGRFVVFDSLASNLAKGDTNSVSDVFVRDRELGTTERVNIGQNGTQANAESYASSGRSITQDGRFVVFESNASNLVPGDSNGASDVFVRDRVTGVTTRASLSSGGAQGDGFSTSAVLSGKDTTGAEGRFVAFASSSTNLVKHDTNGWQDVFVRIR